MTPLDSLEQSLRNKGGRGHGRDWQCPAHEDNRASLSISEGMDGKALLKCHAGCDLPSILAALDLEPEALFPERDKPTHRERLSARPRIAERYPYHDESGAVLFEVVRYAPKDFRQRRPDGNGGWSWKLENVRRVPYRLPELLEAIEAGRLILIAEGEKDVERLRALGFDATCNAGGAGKWLPDFAQVLRAAEVLILPDNDPPGRKHGEEVAESLQGVAASVRVLNLPGLPPKGDVSDWISAGGTREQLLELASSTPDWMPSDVTDEPSGPRVVTVGELIQTTFPPIESVLDPWLRVKNLAMLYAPRGVGKTWLSLSIALATASGSAIFGESGGRPSWRAPKPRDVLLVDGEMPGVLLRQRAIALVNGGEYEPGDRMRILAADMQDRGLPSLAKPEGRELVEGLVEPGGLLILDNISTLCGGISENDADEWGPMQEWLLSLRRQGVTVLLDHHAGRSGQARGTSKREDVLDAVIKLNSPDDYDAVDGARFELHFEKSRGLAGRSVEPFEAELTVIEGPEGRATWKTRGLSEEMTRRIVEMRDGGKSSRVIAEAVGLDQSNVSRRLAKHDKAQLRSVAA